MKTDEEKVAEVVNKMDGFDAENVAISITDEVEGFLGRHHNKVIAVDKIVKQLTKEQKIGVWKALDLGKNWNNYDDMEDVLYLAFVFNKKMVVTFEEKNDTKS